MCSYFILEKFLFNGTDISLFQIPGLPKMFSSWGSNQDSTVSSSNFINLLGLFERGVNRRARKTSNAIGTHSYVRFYIFIYNARNSSICSFLHIHLQMMLRLRYVLLSRLAWKATAHGFKDWYRLQIQVCSLCILEREYYY